MEDNGILYPHTLSYLNGINQLSHKALYDLEKRAMEERRPIVQHDTACYLQMMVQLHRPKKILEIGTNFGYSALCMSLASRHEMIIDTIEYMQDNVDEAYKNFADFGVNNVTVYHLDALEFLTQLSPDYQVDFIFIDANKSDNQTYVEKLTPHLSDNGLILVDNILWKGQVSGHTEVQKRWEKSTAAIKGFNEWMLKNEKYSSQILPIGDGIMMSIKH